MAKRAMITIDENKCDGCGLCVPNCQEGAIQIIDGKARLISDLLCDGLGACVGHCPRGAMKVEEREAEAYDEKKVMSNIVKHGKNVILAHIEHLRSHGQEKYLKEALDFLREHKIAVPETPERKCGVDAAAGQSSGCPGAKVIDNRVPEDSPNTVENGTGTRRSELRQWPLQLHLVPTGASFFAGADVLIAADCVSYALADFHKDHLKGKSLAIACPKLDSGREIYIRKVSELARNADIKTITVMTMEVPCCTGLVEILRKGLAGASRKVPARHLTVSIKGEILKEEKL
ncbi:MAG: 4Fe-4S binding protein [Candidatus Omnitrophota bacterium]